MGDRINIPAKKNKYYHIEYDQANNDEAIA
jgi:hypothetical protein